MATFTLAKLIADWELLNKTADGTPAPEPAARQ
jgi:hypothetical protein